MGGGGALAELRHECAVAAVYDMRVSGSGPPAQSSETLKSTVRMLLDMQTRGQLSAGITTYLPGRSELLKTHKEVGSVDQVFGLSRQDQYERMAEEYDGIAAIGHSRYATTGEDDVRYAQPFERGHGRPWKWFSFAFNGTLGNYSELRERLSITKGYHFTLDADTEVIEHYLAYALRGEEPLDLVSVMEQLSLDFDGAYCLVFLDASGRMMVARDPLGLRPLSWGVKDGVFAAASESVALANLGYKDIRPVAPGEVLVVEKGAVRRSQYQESLKRSHCFFEWVYFASVASTIDGCGVYESRARAGQVLAQQETIPVDADTIAVPVPDTAKGAADSFAYHMNIPCVEGIFRNRYVGRTFIQSPAQRDEAVRNKYTPLPSVLRGKRVFLIEDSVVRSKTLRALAGSIRERCQPRELHLRVACPPIVAPCFYGIDMSTVTELFAPQHTTAESGDLDDETSAKMATALNLDSLRYLKVAEIAEAIGLPQESLCLGCLTGKYPTKSGNELYKAARAKDDSDDTGGRIYP